MLSVLVLGDEKFLEHARSIVGNTGDECGFTLVATTDDAVQAVASARFDLLIADSNHVRGDVRRVIDSLASVDGHGPLFMVTGDTGTDEGTAGAQDSRHSSEDQSGRKARDMFARLGSRITLALERTEPAEREKKQKALLCPVLASINTGVFIVDRRTRIILNANDYAIKILGAPKGDVIGRDYHRFLSLPDTAARVESLSDEAVLQSEGELRVFKGKTIPVMVNITPVRVISEHDLLITFLDISMPKMAEKALIESEMRFGMLVETSPDAILLTDLRGRIIRANNNALALFGFAGEAGIRGSSLRSLIHQNHPRFIRHFIEDVITRGNVRGECDGHSTGGRAIPVEISSSAIRNSDGNPFSLIHVIRDLTYRKSVEEALKASEERYRNVVEDQTEFICRFRPDGTHVFVNDAYCRYFGKERGEITGSRFITDIYPGDLPALREHFASLTPGHPVALIDHRIIMPDGKVRWQRWSDRAIYGKDGILREYQSVGRDITDRKEAEAALSESEIRYRTIFENTGTAMVIIEEDTTIGFANNEFFRLTGYSQEDVGEKKSWKDFVHADDRNLMIEQHRLRRERSGDALRQYEFRLLTKSGGVRNILLTIEMFPGTTRSIASLIDITDSRKVAEALHRGEGHSTSRRGNSGGT